jgi:glycosyltransferase involved in cell wall biosynthesis
LAPIRTGGGVRIKVLEALGQAIPVVTTRLGARGLSHLPIPAHWIGDSAASLVEGVFRILRNPAEARREAEGVRSAMVNDFAPSRETERTLEVWREVQRG